MKHHEVRYLRKKEALDFMHTVTLFAGMGEIRWHMINDDTVKIMATKHAWSMQKKVKEIKNERLASKETREEFDNRIFDENFNKAMYGDD